MVGTIRVFDDAVCTVRVFDDMVCTIRVFDDLYSIFHSELRFIVAKWYVCMCICSCVYGG